MPSQNEDLIDTADLPVFRPRTERPHSQRVHVDIGAMSHCGRVRPNNEDCYLVARFGRSLHTIVTNLPDDAAPPDHLEVGYALAVADGMGGMAAGEVASRSALAGLVQLVCSTPDWILSTDEGMTETVMQRMAERFRQLDELLLEKARNDPALTGMGTTMTLACTLGMHGIVCHVGDSRAYRFRHGELRQLTRDMSLAQGLVDQGILTSAEAAISRLRHILTQCLGGGKTKAEVLHLQLENGDRLLLCSDGLTEMVPDRQIAEIMSKQDAPAQIAQALVNRALEAGGKDNVTVVLGEFRLEASV